MKLLSCVQLLATSWTAAYQAPPSVGFSRQEYWSGVPLPSLVCSFRLLQIKLLWTFVYMFWYGFIFSFLLSKRLEVQWLVVVWLTNKLSNVFWRVIPIYVLNKWEFCCFPCKRVPVPLHPRKRLAYQPFSLFVVLICIFWVMTLKSPRVSCSNVSESLWPYGLYSPQTPLSIGFSRQEYWNG